MLKCSACYIEVQLVKIVVVVVELKGMVNDKDSVTYFPSRAGKPVTKKKKIPWRENQDIQPPVPESTQTPLQINIFLNFNKEINRNDLTKMLANI